jgi:glycosyltransferase involved in cell wall biosynthesis
MKILHFRIKDSTFIRIDQEILDRHFRTRNYRVDTSSPVSYLFALIKLAFFLLWNGRRYDVYYIRFADWHTAIIAFFSRLYRRKFFMVVGGFDVAAIARFRYGAHLNSLRSRAVRYSMNNATCLLPNSECMIYYENRFIQEEIVYGGIRHFVPGIRTRIEVVHNGFDHRLFRCLPGTGKRSLAITVAVIDRPRTFFMKGIDRFIETAGEFPGYDFLVVGISRELLDRMQVSTPANLHTREYTGTDELIGLYSEASVFCLFSLSEGSPNALCEAMLCECVPVGTDVTSIPEIIGDTGFIIRQPVREAYMEQVRMAFTADRQLGRAARMRIKENYSLEQREEKIVSVLSGY